MRNAARASPSARRRRITPQSPGPFASSQARSSFRNRSSSTENAKSIETRVILARPAGPAQRDPYNRDVAAKKPVSKPPPPVPPSGTATLEERGLPIVRELARVARATDPARVKLEGAMEILFGAYGESDPEFSGLFLDGWVRARADQELRLTLAWQREQIRLSLHDILAEGVAAGVFRPDLDAHAVAAVILGAAEGCLLQTASQGGAVPPAEIMQTLLRLAFNAA